MCNDLTTRSSLGGFIFREKFMPNSKSKTYILDDQWTDKDALDFTPYVETLANIIQTGNTPITSGVFGMWGK
jgi:hypothetical protein